MQPTKQFQEESVTVQSSASIGQPPLVLSWRNVAFFGTVHALALLAPWYFSWSALGVAIALHWLFGSIGICLGYHRLLTHRSFQVPKALEYTFALLGAFALQGSPIFWVAGHRLHHAFTEDIDKDPYSAKRGFWWSHMLWILYPRAEFFAAETHRKYAPDLARDRFYNWLDRYFLLLQLPLAVLLFAIGGWSFVIYGMFVRAVLLWHTTWLINSATHLFGNRTFETEDGSRNLWWVALLAFGEGWHNNHHAYPNVAKAGWKWWQVDITWWAIQILKTMGLARKVVMPPLSAKAIASSKQMKILTFKRVPQPALHKNHSIPAPPVLDEARTKSL